MFLCIWYLFEQISARVFLIHLFFYAGFYCTLKVCRCQDLLVLDGVYTRLKKGGGGGAGDWSSQDFLLGGPSDSFYREMFTSSRQTGTYWQWVLKLNRQGGQAPCPPPLGYVPGGRNSCIEEVLETCSMYHIFIFLNLFLQGFFGYVV